MTLVGLFPVLEEWHRLSPEIPRFVPWALVEPHRRQAFENHDQSLELLAKRGGLDAWELWCVVHDKHLVYPSTEERSRALEWLRDIGVRET